MELTPFQRFFPRVALRHAMAQKQLTLALDKRYYEGAKKTKFRKAAAPDVSAQSLTQQGARELRRYARQLDENHDLAIGVLDALVNNVVGMGLPIQPAVKTRGGELHTDTNMEIARAWAMWSRAPSTDGITPLGQLQRLLARSWLRDGEVLINQIIGTGFDHAGAVPYSLQVLEADHMPYELNSDTGAQIVQGVEIDNFFRPKAYYISTIHPGDTWQASTAGFLRANDYTRLPADQVLHLKLCKRLNQVRGVSVLHGVIRRLEDIKDYVESERIAARIAASWTAQIKRSPDAATVLDTETGNREISIEQGTIFSDLLPGEEIQVLENNRPNPEINNFIAGQLRSVAAGTGTNYSTISRDYSGSYSSQRQSMVEAKTPYDSLRQYFADVAMRPIYDGFLRAAILSGNVVIPRQVDPATVNDAAISGVNMLYIDPRREVEADVLKIQNGLASRSQIISERGGDPLMVARQRENDVDIFGPIVEPAEAAPPKPESDDA